MSLAASTVETCASNAPPRALHPSASALAPLTKACSSARSSGVGSIPRKASRPASSRQSIGAESPTPRGSKPTMSYAARTGAPTIWLA
ncbi:MAG: hypothetical protein BWY91_01886 [bacterium ADurb.BinA028]|nr:MAG: hypothetical protein BWY91_01886 [bacterium ADurb.BinA028]